MPLSDDFWLPKPTDLLEDWPEGVITIDVVLYRRENWPEAWDPENVWDLRDLREISVGFREAEPVKPKAIASVKSTTLVEVEAAYFGGGVPTARCGQGL